MLRGIQKRKSITLTNINKVFNLLLKNPPLLLGGKPHPPLSSQWVTGWAPAGCLFALVLVTERLSVAPFPTAQT